MRITVSTTLLSPTAPLGLLFALLLAMSPGLAGIRPVHADSTRPPVLIVYDSWQQLPHPTKDTLERRTSPMRWHCNSNNCSGIFPSLQS